jgi:FAD/FMN-containing dehydrogenase
MVKTKIISLRLFVVVCVVIAVIAVILAISIVKKEPSSILCSRNRLLHVINPLLRFPTTLGALQNEIRSAYGGISVYGSLHREKNVLYLDMSKMNAIKGISSDGRFVTVEAGVTVGTLLEHLANYGLTLAETPWTRDECIGVVITNGIHGVCGKTLSSTVKSITWVTANGDVKETNDEDKEFKALLISMGTIGVPYSFTLRIVTSHYVEHVRKNTTIDDVRKNTPKMFLWDPKSNSCLSYEWRRLDGVSIDLDVTNHRIKKYSIREHMVSNKIVGNVYSNVTSTIPFLRKGAKILHKALDTGEVLVGPMDILSLPLQPTSQSIPTIDIVITIKMEHFSFAMDILRNTPTNIPTPLYGYKIYFGDVDDSAALSPSFDGYVVYISAMLGIHDKRDSLAKYMYEHLIVSMDGRYAWGSYIYKYADKDLLKKGYGERWNDYERFKAIHDPNNIMGEMI